MNKATFPKQSIFALRIKCVMLVKWSLLMSILIDSYFSTDEPKSNYTSL